MSNLAEEYPKEQARCRELLITYRELPNNAGVIGAMFISAVLEQADKAAASGSILELETYM